MNAYLQIAQDVLSHSTEALSAKEILDRAFMLNIVPPHLYGKTQHKTLHARLAEDILIQKQKSSFYRTQPGKFFLRTHPSITDPFSEVGSEFHAPKRKKDLKTAYYLCFRNTDKLNETELSIIDADSIEENLIYRKYEEIKDDDCSVPIIAFMQISKPGVLLSYRLGKFRPDGNTLFNKRSIGFSYLVEDYFYDLFNRHDYGMKFAAIKGITEDLCIENERSLIFSFNKNCVFKYSKIVSLYPGLGTVMVRVYETPCPDHFEPTSSKLAINDLQWISLDAIPNDVEDFEPISKSLLSEPKLC